MTEDAQWLQRFIDTGDESAFQELVARHLDLVYSVALRQLNGDAHLAQDVAQTVFVDLARKARSLNHRTVLTGWLYEAARLAAAKAVRAEQRRRAREQESMAMHDLTPDPTPDWEILAPVLEQAMGELNTDDRNAVLLRFFERKALGAIGQVLGISEDAAQKRVGRALDKLRTRLLRRGVTLSAPAVAAAITTAAVQAAPPALALSIGTTAVMQAASVGTSIGLTAFNFMAMTKLKLAVAGAIVVAGMTTPWVLQHQTNVKLRTANDALRQQADQAALLAAENDRLSTLVAQSSERRPDSVDSSELLKLRAEVARLRAAEKSRATEQVAEGAAKSWLSRLEQLKQRLELTPEARVPEFQFLTEEDWLEAAKTELKTEDDYRRAFSKLRAAAEGKFARMLHGALKKHLKSNEQQLPIDLAQLQSHFESPIDTAILDRWHIAPAATVKSLGLGGDIIITQKEAVDDMYDTRFGIGPYGHGATDFLSSKTRGTMTSVFDAFRKANNGEFPDDLSLLRPYVTTPDQKIALEKLIQKKAAEK